MRASVVTLAFGLFACGGGGGVDHPTAELTEIGEIGPVVDDLSPDAPSDSYIVRYEITEQYALVRGQISDGSIATVLVDLDGSGVRGACEELFPSAAGEQLVELDGVPTRMNGGRIAPFRVEGDVVEMLLASSLVRCQVGDMWDAPGSVLETIPLTAGSRAPLRESEYHTLVTTDGIWLDPGMRLSWDGSTTETDWTGFSILSVARLHDRGGFVVGALEDSSGDIVGFSTDVDGSRAEFARVAGASTAYVDADGLQATIGAQCTLVKLDGSTGTIDDACGGVLTRDGSGYLRGLVWHAFDGSSTVDHTPVGTAPAFVSRAGRAFTISQTGTTFSFWARGLNEPGGESGGRFDWDLPNCMGSCVTSAEFYEYDNGLCVVAPNISADVRNDPQLAVFNCTDPSNARTFVGASPRILRTSRSERGRRLPSSKRTSSLATSSSAISTPRFDTSRPSFERSGSQMSACSSCQIEMRHTSEAWQSDGTERSSESMVRLVESLTSARHGRARDHRLEQARLTLQLDAESLAHSGANLVGKRE